MSKSTHELPREHRDAHARLAALPTYRHVKQTTTQAEEREARGLGTARVGVKSGPRSRRGIALDIAREVKGREGGTMTPGAVVEVVSGPWVGRIGTVDAVTVEGLAVRLRTEPGRPRLEVVVVPPTDVRVVDLRVTGWAA